ncbi:hypothetical protein R5W23_000121 [Gemmata sp. JC673]|uniref:Uncharacterized protein n=1 Tax=Gemmata algarum TaxID=2975278 RepID=A0ABU5EVD9_9BACT|nr:hypothetical protein [Gemmata algarum]MDY3557594.1 hypothetical protein [Gemmata algarum]
MANKKKASGKQPHAQQPALPMPSQNTTQLSETDRKQNSRITLTMTGTLVAFALNLVMAYFSWSSAGSAQRSADEAKEANKLSQANLDRAAGRVTAKFEFLEEKSDPARFKDFMKEKDGFGTKVLRMDEPEDLLRWGPRVRLKNTGTEPIDAIRISVNYAIGAAYGKNVQQLDPPPIVINEESSHEFTTFGKLQPGKVANIFVSPLLAAQMTRVKFPHYSDKDQTGIFTVRAYCRLVGSASYDRADESQTMCFHFDWRPAGFSSESKSVKDILEVKPWVTID